MPPVRKAKLPADTGLPSTLKAQLKPKHRLHQEEQTLFDRIAEEVVHGDRELFDTLSAHERKLVTDWLAMAVIEGPDNVVSDVLWEVDYVRKPVSIETFLTDEYYFGKKTANLHDNWMSDLTEVLGFNSVYSEYILTGAIGTGKTTCAVAALGYKAYLMSCLRDPAKYYGLLPEEKIYFGVYSISKQQVSDAGYYKLRSMIDSSPYFRVDFPRDKDIDSLIRFKNQPFEVMTGSRDLHALGLDLFSFMMDEVNFMRVVEDEETAELKGQAYEIYNATTSRLLSRFSRPGGVIPGIAMLLSSRTAQTSFLEERIEKARENPHCFVSDYKLWECKPKHRFASIWGMPAPVPTFEVEVGDRTANSRILNPGDKPREGSKTVTIPGELREKFEEDVNQALRDLAGVATFNLNPLISDRQSIFEAVRGTMKHPFSQESVILDFKDDYFIEDSFLLKEVCRVEGSKYIPRLNAGCPRYVHCDLALSGDSAALAMSHMSGMKSIRRPNPDGTESREESPFILVDLMLRILPPKGSQIDLGKIRAFIFYLRKFFPLHVVTCDGFQSADMLQMLSKQGLTAKLLSIDREDIPYLSLRAAHFERRIGMYHYGPYVDEVLDLTRNVRKRKVDHPAKNSRGGKGSKDVADAVCGSVWNCINSDVAVKSAPPVLDDGQPRLVRQVIDPADPNPKKVIVRQDMPLVATALPAPETPPKTTGPVPRRINGTGLQWGDLRKNLQQR
jgi:hypothetical protein